MNAFKKAPEIVEPTLQKAIVASQALLAKHTTRETVPFRTGTLIRTFQFTSSRLLARWFPTRQYALYVHQGTGVYAGRGPITIYPKNKLALYWPGADHPVKKVTIQGIKPNPFMPRIAQAASPDINNLFATAMTIIARDLTQKI